jgi:MOSC domain-containing protein YiiM
MPTSKRGHRTLPGVGSLVSVNVAVPRASRAKGLGFTGIDKRPAAGPVEVHAPGATGSGVTGDRVYDTANHGGDDKAVYAYAREDLDAWAAELGRELPAGVFGENFTTAGLDVTGARIGERWAVGDDLVLAVAIPRVPCATFAEWMTQRGWIKRFVQRAVPGAYLRVVAPGTVRAGDPIKVISRPVHDVSIGVVFRAVTLEPDLLPRLVDVADLPLEVRQQAARRIA